MKIVNRVNTKFLGAVVLLFLVGLAINTIAKPHPPGLSEVLSGPKSSLDLNFFLLGLCALSLTTLTLAKSYEIISRKKGALPQKQENENLKRIRSKKKRPAKAKATKKRKKK